MKTFAEWKQDNPGGDVLAYERYQKQVRDSSLWEELTAERGRLVELKGKAVKWGSTYYAISRALDQLDHAISHARNGF